MKSKSQKKIEEMVVMGNRWNNKTQSLPRPKVCKSALPGEGEIRCVVKPNAVTVNIGLEQDFFVLAWRSIVPGGTEVTMVIETTLSTISDVILPTNENDFTGQFTLDDPGEDGLEFVTVTLTFEDNTQCVLFITITWIDP